MKNQNLPISIVGGLHQRQPQPANTASVLTNWTVDTYTGGWSNHIGYERYLVKPETLFYPFDQIRRIESLFILKKRNGAQDTLICESAKFNSPTKMFLLHDFGVTHPLANNDSLKPIRNRARTPPTEPCTQYTVMGRFMIATNGSDQPLKYLGWPVPDISLAWDTAYSPVVFPLGWEGRPDTPTAWNIETDPTVEQANGRICCVQSKSIGLGIATDTKENAYRWKVAFVNNSGSESPLSDASNTITWATTASLWRYAAYVEIPLGPTGTVARRLYRTMNFSDDGANDGSLFYFVKDINNNTDTATWDTAADIELSSAAPLPTYSTVNPSPEAKFCATFGDCLFIDGGAEDDTVLYYSDPGRPDQFNNASFLMVGNRQTGAITGLYPYFNFLLVLREQGIDVITGSYPAFNAIPISTNVGTRAVNTVTQIPGIGLIFLASDGVYVVNANLQYSDSPGVTLVSGAITKTIKRLTQECLSRAVATYSHKWKEWHCYFAADGAISPNLGIVYHVEKNAWSIREGFDACAVQTDFRGNIVFGINGSGVKGAPAGLFVLSNRRALGQISDGATPPKAVDNPPPVSKFASPWQDFGNENEKKRVHYVYLYVLTGGDQTITMKYRKDFDWNAEVSSPAMKLQRADHLDQSVYGTVKVETTSTKPWEEPFVTPIRFPIKQGSCTHFQFEFETTDDMIFIGYSVQFTMSGINMITGKRL